MTTTRIYVGGAAGISPAVSADWYNSTGLVRLAAATTKPNTAMANTTSGATIISAEDFVTLQVVYPLPTGTKFTSGSDTLHGYFLASETSATGNISAQLGARVIASDGTTVQAVLMSIEASPTLTSEFSTTLTNRRFPRLAASNTVGATYTSVSGDYLVVELGGRKPSSSNQSHSIRYGSVTGSTDLGANETDTTQTLCPWIEFTHTTSVDASATMTAGTVTLTGQAATGMSVTAPASVGTQSTLTLTGQALTAARYAASASTATQAGLTLTGQALAGASAQTYATVASQAVVTLTGQDVQATWEAPDTAILSRATLTLTGQGLTGTTESLANITTGTLTLTGQDAAIGAAVSAITGQGAITLTGQDVSAAAILAAIVAQGTMTLTGRDVAISSAAVTTAMGQAQITFTGMVVVVRQGFTYYQVHII